MAQTDFKKVKNFRQRDKDIVYGFIKEIQSVFPKDNSYYNIHDLIKHLCLLYFHHIIDSKLLTDIEQETLMKLFRDHNKDDFDQFHWQLIYRASRDGSTEKNAKEKYEYKKNLVAFIHTENDNIFGGYTSHGWDHSDSNDGVYHEDKHAFVFGIRSSQNHEPIIRNVKKGREGQAMFSRKGYFLIWNYMIYICDRTYTADLYDSGTYQSCPSVSHFTGGLGVGEANIKDIEVFQLV